MGQIPLWFWLLLILICVAIIVILENWESIWTSLSTML